MAWVEQCKIDAKAQIEHMKGKKGNVKAAIEKLAKESGIPKGTLNRWYYDKEKRQYTKNGAVYPQIRDRDTINEIPCDIHVRVSTSQEGGKIITKPGKIKFGFADWMDRKVLVIREYIEDKGTWNHIMIPLELIQEFKEFFADLEVELPTPEPESAPTPE